MHIEQVLHNLLGHEIYLLFIYLLNHLLLFFTVFLISQIQLLLLYLILCFFLPAIKKYFLFSWLSPTYINSPSATCRPYTSESPSGLVRNANAYSQAFRNFYWDLAWNLPKFVVPDNAKKTLFIAVSFSSYSGCDIIGWVYILSPSCHNPTPSPH